jgi:acetolactate synthase-1/2/3 large subunit
MTNGAQRTIEHILAQGIHTVVGIPGGNILPLYDALHGSRLRHILARHEQGAAFIAQGMARATGKTAVCLATSGPGATNLVTALADAEHDAVPIVAITGQVPRDRKGMRSFQEADIASIARPCVKAAWEIRNCGELDTILPQAFETARSGRPGPVLVDIPKDIFLEAAAPWRGLHPHSSAPPAIATDSVLSALEMIGESRRPLLLAGGGLSRNGSRIATEFAEATGIPVASTLHGLGAIPTSHPLFLGMIGMHGNPSANHAVNDCDLLIVAGARLEERATGEGHRFAPKARILRLDTDARQMRMHRADLAIAGDALAVLEALLAGLREFGFQRFASGSDKFCRSHPPERGPAHHLLETIAHAMGHDSLWTTDVGQHQMWAAQSLPISRSRQFLTSGGFGTMGFGLPAAIGASLATQGSPVGCIAGDGSILMNIQEMATLAELDLPVKIFLLDNGGLGMVRQQQDLFYGSRQSACGFQGSLDFAKIARGFAIAGLNVRPDQIEDDGWKRLAQAPGPALISFRIEAEEKVWPVVRPGQNLHDMIHAPA